MKNKENNKNGFTLIELIVVIALIAVLSIAVGLNADKLFANSTNSQNEQTMKDIFEAASIYNNTNNQACESSSGCKISAIISKGLLDGKKANPMYNGEYIERKQNDYIKITYNSEKMKVITYYCSNGKNSIKDSDVEKYEKWGEC